MRKLCLEQTLIKNYALQFIAKDIHINYIGYCYLDDQIELVTVTFHQ